MLFRFGHVLDKVIFPHGNPTMEKRHRVLPFLYIRQSDHFSLEQKHISTDDMLLGATSSNYLLKQ